MVHPAFTASEVQMAIDDDEEDSYVFLRLAEGGYFDVGSNPGMDAVYCEFLDQANGFESRTVRYEIGSRKVRFSVSGDEYFEPSNRIQRLDVLIPEDVVDMSPVEACLAAVFDAGSAQGADHPT
jgi:hypothetical protein